jgi:hypothetical protein
MAPRSGERPLISVIIPNWNGANFLPLCLDSLKKQDFKNFETIVVDNGSEDDSLDILKDNYPWVKALPLENNHGFAGGCNRGMETAQGEWIVLLNNDTEADTGWLKEISRAIAEYSEYSFFSTKILMFGDREYLDGTGDYLPRSLYAFRYGQFVKDEGQFDNLGDIFSPCGAAAVYKKTMLDDIGLLDEDFFAYLEDIDLGLRAHLKGYKGRFIPESKIYHIGAGSTDSEKMSPWVYKQNIRNRHLIVFKTLPVTVYLCSLPSIIFWHMADLARHPARVPGYLKGYFESLALLPQILKKRRNIMKTRKVSSRYIYNLLKEGSRLYMRQRSFRRSYIIEKTKTD